MTDSTRYIQIKSAALQIIKQQTALRNAAAERTLKINIRSKNEIRPPIWRETRRELAKQKQLANDIRPVRDAERHFTVARMEVKQSL